jgi:signal transduction histidine kinase
MASVTLPGSSPHALAHELLGAGGHELDELVDLLRDSVGVDLATIAVLDDGRFHFLVCSGAEPFAADHDDAICSWSMGDDRVVSLPDLSGDERTRGLPYVDGRLASLRFYASAPLHSPEGTLVGRLCLFDGEPRTLTPSQESLLRVLADSVSAHLDVRIRARATLAQPEGASDDEAATSRIQHDLRSPLGSMRTSLDLLAEVTDATEGTTAHRLLGIANRSALRLTGLVEGLALLHEMTTAPSVEVVHLGDVVERALAAVENERAAVDGYIEAAHLPVLACDPDRIMIVLIELLSNALRHRDPGTAPHITVSAQRIGIDWRVSVTDDGPGVPVRDRERIFDVLTRLSARPGRGLGLPIALRAVAGLGGRMGIQDGPDGVGTTVWFDLPG